MLSDYRVPKDKHLLEGGDRIRAANGLSGISECHELCLETEDCGSYSYKNGTGRCHIYDAATRAHPVATEEGDFFATKNKISGRTHNVSGHPEEPTILNYRGT